MTKHLHSASRNSKLPDIHDKHCQRTLIQGSNEFKMFRYQNLQKSEALKPDSPFWKKPLTTQILMMPADNLISEAIDEVHTAFTAFSASLVEFSEAKLSCVLSIRDNPVQKLTTAFLNLHSALLKLDIDHRTPVAQKKQWMQIVLQKVTQLTEWAASAETQNEALFSDQSELNKALKLLEQADFFVNDRNALRVVLINCFKMLWQTQSGFTTQTGSTTRMGFAADIQSFAEDYPAIAHLEIDEYGRSVLSFKSQAFFAENSPNPIELIFTLLDSMIGGLQNLCDPNQQRDHEIFEINPMPDLDLPHQKNKSSDDVDKFTLFRTEIMSAFLDTLTTLTTPKVPLVKIRYKKSLQSQEYTALIPCELAKDLIPILKRMLMPINTAFKEIDGLDFLDEWNILKKRLEVVATSNDYTVLTAEGASLLLRIFQNYFDFNNIDERVLNSLSGFKSYFSPNEPALHKMRSHILGHPNSAYYCRDFKIPILMGYDSVIKITFEILHNDMKKLLDVIITNHSNQNASQEQRPLKNEKPETRQDTAPIKDFSADFDSFMSIFKLHMPCSDYAQVDARNKFSEMLFTNIDAHAADNYAAHLRKRLQQLSYSSPSQFERCLFGQFLAVSNEKLQEKFKSKLPNLMSHAKVAAHIKSVISAMTHEENTESRKKQIMALEKTLTETGPFEYLCHDLIKNALEKEQARNQLLADIKCSENAYESTAPYSAVLFSNMLKSQKKLVESVYITFYDDPTVQQAYQSLEKKREQYQLRKNTYV